MRLQTHNDTWDGTGSIVKLRMMQKDSGDKTYKIKIGDNFHEGLNTEQRLPSAQNTVQFKSFDGNGHRGFERCVFNKAQLSQC